MRQWDTKEQFKPDYRGCVRMVLLGWYDDARSRRWRWYLSELWGGLYGLGGGLLTVAAGLVIAMLAPVTVPLLLLAHGRSVRRRRLNYIRRNRKADADI